jgi:acyl-CoA reductase-like NAD-dependent aldehyde dehydrogenase
MASVDTTAAQRSNGEDEARPPAEIPVENPATGEVIAHVADLSAERVAELAARGRAAQPGWQAVGFDERVRVLRRMQKWIMDNADRVVATIVSETGKTYEDAYMAEINYIGGAIDYWTKNGPGFLEDESIHASTLAVKGKKMVVRYEPLGLVGVIGPWNYPLTNSFGDCLPAMLAGNSVILKPSEITPLTSLLLAEGLAESGLPDGVFQVATGRGETGAALVDVVDMIMFTGSTATGKKVMERAAQTLTPVSLELGGKDPMIVLADADLERAANLAVYYSMLNAGQTCISIERVYVEQPVYDDFVRRVVEKVGALRQGESTGPATAEVGAMTFPKQLEIVEEHVRDALAKGARALTGGKRREGKGLFYEPTVLVDVDHSMKAMTEETFGPTLPIMQVADAEEALTLANDSPYGLGGAVFTGDRARGEQLARRMQAGAVCINDALLNYVAVELPMGGWKASGMGSRHGAAGIRKFTKQQSLFISRLHLKRDPYGFPYRPATSKLLFKGLRLLYGRGRRR